MTSKNLFGREHSELDHQRYKAQQRAFEQAGQPSHMISSSKHQGESEDTRKEFYRIHGSRELTVIQCYISYSNRKEQTKAIRLLRVVVEAKQYFNNRQNKLTRQGIRPLSG